MAQIELVFRPEAEADIRKIANYTEAQWGRAQAKRYLADINAAIKGLILFPRKGTEVGSLGENYRKITSGYHRIFYTSENTTVVIVRILHERMDLESEMGSEDFH